MKKLLEELYEAEPELREKEEQIEKIIAQMLVIKPKVNISKDFKRTLERRLISIIPPGGKERRVKRRNEYFRIFWYIFWSGILASFAISFGFLSYFEQTPSTEILPPSNNIALLSVPSDSASTADSMAAPMVMKSEKSENLEVAKSLPKTAKKVAPVATTSAPNLMTMDSWTPVAPEKSETPIAYVGEEFTPESSSNMQPMAKSFGATPSPQAESDTFSAQPPPTAPAVPKITFAEIILRAQKQANLLIDEKDRPFYTLWTPYTDYISKHGTGSNDNMEQLTQVYVFPLKRTDGGEIKVKKVEVVVE